jgi:hypothetical protein
VFFIYGGIRDRCVRRNTVTVLYNIPGIFAFDIIDRNYHYIISSGLTSEKEKRIISNCNKFWLMQRTVKPVFIDMEEKDMSCQGLTILSGMDDKIRIIVFRDKCFVVINDLLNLNNYSSVRDLKPDLVLINSGGILRIPSCISLSATRCIAVSSGDTKRLFTREFLIEEGKNLQFVDVRTGEAMLECFLVRQNNAVFPLFFNAASKCRFQ